VSTSARLVSIIAIAAFVVPAAGFQGEMRSRGFDRGTATAAWPSVFDYLYGGIDGAYGPEIYEPEQSYLQTYLYGGPPATAYGSANRQPIVR